jgi:UDP-N-acetylglucosamine 2-epimerase (non-hydrolysing)
VELAGTDEDAVFAAASRLLQDASAYQTMRKAVNPYGDGYACCRIADAILWWSGLKENAPDEFQAGQ